MWGSLRLAPITGGKVNKYLTMILEKNTNKGFGTIKDNYVINNCDNREGENVVLDHLAVILTSVKIDKSGSFVYKM